MTTRQRETQRGTRSTLHYKWTLESARNMGCQMESGREDRSVLRGFCPFHKMRDGDQAARLEPGEHSDRGGHRFAPHYVQVGVKDAPVRAACGAVSTTGADGNGLTHSITAENGKFSMNAGTDPTPRWPPSSTTRSPPVPATSSAEKPTGPV